MKNVTRRKFLGAAAATAGAAFSLKANIFEQPTSLNGHARLAQLDWATFLKCRNTAFSFSMPGIEPVDLTLASVEDSRRAGKRARPAGQECFVLKFTSGVNSKLPQDTYDVNHSMLGDFKLFITEGRRMGRERTFFAVINRVTS